MEVGDAQLGAGSRCGPPRRAGCRRSARYRRRIRRGPGAGPGGVEGTGQIQAAQLVVALRVCPGGQGQQVEDLLLGGVAVEVVSPSRRSGYQASARVRKMSRSTASSGSRTWKTMSLRDGGREVAALIDLWSPIRRRRGTDFLIVTPTGATIGEAAARSAVQSVADNRHYRRGRTSDGHAVGHTVGPRRAPAGAAGRGPIS